MVQYFVMKALHVEAGHLGSQQHFYGLLTDWAKIMAGISRQRILKHGEHLLN